MSKASKIYQQTTHLAQPERYWAGEHKEEKQTIAIYFDKITRGIWKGCSCLQKISHYELKERLRIIRNFLVSADRAKRPNRPQWQEKKY